MEQYHIYHAAAPMSADKARDLLNLMEQSFPENERRVRAGQKRLFTHPLYRVAAAEENGRLLGFIAFWTMNGFRYFEHFATRPELRGQGVGGRLLDWTLKTLGTPAVLEVELPEDDLKRRRIGFYRRHGFFLNERPYLQMPLREGDQPMPQYIMSYPRMLDDGQFDACRRQIYREVYGVTEV